MPLSVLGVMPRDRLVEPGAEDLRLQDDVVERSHRDAGRLAAGPRSLPLAAPHQLAAARVADEVDLVGVAEARVVVNAGTGEEAWLGSPGARRLPRTRTRRGSSPSARSRCPRSRAGAPRAPPGSPSRSEARGARAVAVAVPASRTRPARPRRGRPGGRGLLGRLRRWCRRRRAAGVDHRAHGADPEADDEQRQQRQPGDHRVLPDEQGHVVPDTRVDEPCDHEPDRDVEEEDAADVQVHCSPVEVAPRLHRAAGGRDCIRPRSGRRHLGRRLHNAGG